MPITKHTWLNTHLKKSQTEVVFNFINVYALFEKHCHKNVTEKYYRRYYYIRGSVANSLIN